MCAAYAAYARVLQSEDEAARKKRPDDAPPATPLPSDGRSFYMRQMSPDEFAAARAAQQGPAGRSSLT